MSALQGVLSQFRENPRGRGGRKLKGFYPEEPAQAAPVQPAPGPRPQPKPVRKPGDPNPDAQPGRLCIHKVPLRERCESCAAAKPEWYESKPAKPAPVATRPTCTCGCGSRQPCAFAFVNPDTPQELTELYFAGRL